jgi:hypothetical protein
MQADRSTIGNFPHTSAIPPLPTGLSVIVLLSVPRYSMRPRRPWISTSKRFEGRL